MYYCRSKYQFSTFVILCAVCSVLSMLLKQVIFCEESPQGHPWHSFYCEVNKCVWWKQPGRFVYMLFIFELGNLFCDTCSILYFGNLCTCTGHWQGVTRLFKDTAFIHHQWKDRGVRDNENCISSKRCNFKD